VGVFETVGKRQPELEREGRERRERARRQQDGPHLRRFTV
jgi:hypothetical protein